MIQVELLLHFNFILRCKPPKIFSKPFLFLTTQMNRSKPSLYKYKYIFNSHTLKVV